MSGPLHKRRRLDSALHKPFRSPLKTATSAKPSEPTSASTSPSASASTLDAAPASTSSLGLTLPEPPSTPATSRTTGVRAGLTPRNPLNPLHRPFTPSSLRGAFSIPKPDAASSVSDELDSQEGAAAWARTEQIKTPSASTRFRSPVKATPASVSASAVARKRRRQAQGCGDYGDDDDEELAALETEVMSLSTQTRVLRSQIDTLRQAAGLPSSVFSSSSSSPSSASTSPLPALITKWRHIAQEAADVVFEDVAARVKDMGGMEGYKKRERDDKRLRWREEEAWDVGNAFSSSSLSASNPNGNGGEDGEESMGAAESADHSSMQLDHLERLREKVEHEHQRQQDQEQDDGDDDVPEEFTMDTMLAMLHIDPHVIGWDPAKACWVDG